MGLIQRAKTAHQAGKAHAATIHYGDQGWHCNTCRTGSGKPTMPAAQADATAHNAQRHSGRLALVRNDG